MSFTIEVVHGSLIPTHPEWHRSTYVSVVRVRREFGALLLWFEDGDSVCLARGAWLAYEEHHGDEQVSRCPSPADMPMARRTR